MKRHKSPTIVVTLYLTLMIMGAAVFSQQACADQILVDAPSAGYFYYGMYSPYSMAASFTLTGSEYVSTIDVVLHTPSTTSFTTFDFSLQNSLTSPFTTFANAALTAPLGGVSTKTINVNKTLPAGTYYLIGIVPGYAGTPATPGDVDGWMLSTGVYNNAAGTVTDGVWFFNGATWLLTSGYLYDNGSLSYAPAFSVNGQSGSFGNLVISPASRAVANEAGATTFSVTNTGVGTMPWTATVTSGDSWLWIPPGTSGSNTGTINCSFTANASSAARTGTIRVTATGATGSPVDVTVTQAPAESCTATLDGNLLIHIPVLASLMDWWWAPAYLADFVYEYNPTYPTLIIFKMTSLTMLPVYRPECVKDESTYTDDYFKIHIPGLLLADGITRLSVDMEYSPAFSTNGNTCFVVTKIE
jgi:Viral BACON domain